MVKNIASTELNDQGKRLLKLLSEKIQFMNPERPETYISYSEAHKALGLNMRGETFGNSLKHQGLANLADWTASQGKPAITGAIIDFQTKMPGQGYFALFGRTIDQEGVFEWWKNEIKKSKEYDWNPYYQNPELKHVEVAATPETPPASDLDPPPGRIETTTYRILRDSEMARKIKALHNYECQICGHIIILPHGKRYAEAHHIQPLGGPHNGPDVADNIMCLCPNHHAELDYGVRKIVSSDLRHAEGHSISEKFADYHNEKIYGNEQILLDTHHVSC